MFFFVGLSISKKAAATSISEQVLNSDVVKVLVSRTAPGTPVVALSFARVQKTRWIKCKKKKFDHILSNLTSIN